MKNKYIAYGLFLILFMAFWNLLDYIYATVITHSGYRFGAGTDLLIPLVVAGVSGYLLFLRKQRTDDTLPYESMKIDRLRGGSISFSETKEYGEVQIREEGDKVLISIIGVDNEGSFSAASAFTIDEFMSGEDNWLEQTIGSILFYGKVYED